MTAVRFSLSPATMLHCASTKTENVHKPYLLTGNTRSNAMCTCTHTHTLCAFKMTQSCCMVKGGHLHLVRGFYIGTLVDQQLNSLRVVINNSIVQSLFFCFLGKKKKYYSKVCHQNWGVLLRTVIWSLLFLLTNIGFWFYCRRTGEDWLRYSQRTRLERDIKGIPPLHLRRHRPGEVGYYQLCHNALLCATECGPLHRVLGHWHPSLTRTLKKRTKRVLLLKFHLKMIKLKNGCLNLKWLWRRTGSSKVDRCPS